MPDLRTPVLTAHVLQAALALAAAWTSQQVGERVLTGIVIGSGDGVTHAIPVVSRLSVLLFVGLTGRELREQLKERKAFLLKILLLKS